MINRLVREMGVDTTGDTAVNALGTSGSASEFTMQNNPVIFGDTFISLFARYAGWRLPKDQMMDDGSPPRPVANHIITS